MLTRINLLLFFALIACALGVVTSQNQARELYVQLQKEQDISKKLDVEWGQLQLEQSTWSMHSRIEDIATRQLHMKVPSASRIVILPVPAEPKP